MPVLKSLSFTVLPKPSNDVVQIRRANFVAKLEEQKQLLKDPNHVRTTQRWTKVDGERQAVAKQQAVRPMVEDRPIRSGLDVDEVRLGRSSSRRGRPASWSARRKSCRPSSMP
jgi:hypothetical protein